MPRALQDWGLPRLCPFICFDFLILSQAVAFLTSLEKPLLSPFFSNPFFLMRFLALSTVLTIITMRGVIIMCVGMQCRAETSLETS